MTRILILPLSILTLTFAAGARAHDVIPVLKTTNPAGTLIELRDVRVMKVEPDGLRVMHSNGTAKVPFERLSEELRIKFGIDPSKALQHRAAAKAAANATAAAQTAAAAATSPQASQAISGTLVTKDDVKAAWLRECEQTFICPSDPQGAAKRQALAQRVAAIRAGSWDSTAETYAKQANARAAAGR